MKTEWYDRMIKALQLNGKGDARRRSMYGPCACSPSSMASLPISLPKNKNMFLLLPTCALLLIWPR